MNLKRLNRKLAEKYGGRVEARFADGCVFVSGRLGRWDDIVEACRMCVSKDKSVHVVNDIEPDGFEIPQMRLPSLRDNALDGQRPDVLIIGGGISGTSIARELSRRKINILLVEKEADLAVQASGRNDGEVHPGVDLNRGSLKQRYVVQGNRMFDKIARELDVPFIRCGQYVGFTNPFLRPVVEIYALQRKHVCGVSDTRVIGRKELFRAEPSLNPRFRFALYNPSAGSVSPYELTIACAENAAANGARISLNTAVIGMKIEDGEIVCVETNRGKIYPMLVINAAGVFAEDVAAMACDRFYSIHPRRGTDFILDKKTAHMVNGISSIKTLKKTEGHTKGGGIIHTADGNLLVGPDAVETYEKENFSTDRSSIDTVFAKQKNTAPGLEKKDIITYFTGVRAATFEEDFIIEKGRKTKNLIHCAGIQSPGLTTAPAVAADIAETAVQMLGERMTVEENTDFDPIRKAPPRLRDLPEDERDTLIKKNPDYGVIVCRCEEISKGEILDALSSPVCPPTTDAVKRRVRPGMGRCQGGFCLPLVTEIISEYDRIPVSAVKKSGGASVISFGPK